MISLIIFFCYRRSQLPPFQYIPTLMPLGYKEMMRGWKNVCANFHITKKKNINKNDYQHILWFIS